MLQTMTVVTAPVCAGNLVHLTNLPPKITTNLDKPTVVCNSIYTAVISHHVIMCCLLFNYYCVKSSCKKAHNSL